MMSETVNLNTFDSIVRENKIYRFSSELQYSEDDDRKNLLREILKKIQNDTSNKSVKVREEISILCEKMNANQYKKKWHRLNEEQKKDQIQKYFSEKIEDNVEREKEMNKVFNMLDNDKLKNTHIKYDEKEGKIENIEYEKKEKKPKAKKSKKKDIDESGDDE